MTTDTTCPPAAPGPELDVEIVLGSRGPTTCPCGRRLPRSRGDVFELEYGGRTLCHDCCRIHCLGPYRAATALSFIFEARRHGRRDAADDVMATLSAGLDLLAEYEAEQRQDPVHRRHDGQPHATGRTNP